jgi:hypothetical protein
VDAFLIDDDAIEIDAAQVEMKFRGHTFEPKGASVAAVEQQVNNLLYDGRLRLSDHVDQLT